MEISQILYRVFVSIYTFSMVMVCLYGFHRFFIVGLFLKHRKRHHEIVEHFTELPRVTIQLPMYNEMHVARRVIERACEIDYPADKLQIQVLDDSTDNTTEIVLQAVDEMKREGVDIECIHRSDRTGYKAGALEAGLKSASGEFVAIFDADFIPDPQFLNRSIHYFSDPQVCVVQTRWEHLNRSDSMLTQSQAIFLDGHFAIEHVARNRSDRFMSFNGTAGTWRKAAIQHAGGWQHDTLTEDLDLSYRAQLKGWKFIFLPDLASPAELPPEMNAFKAQQFRWTKGGAQTAIKILPKLMLSKAPFKVKLEGFFHLTCFSMHFYMLLLVLLLYPVMYFHPSPIDENSMLKGVVDIFIFMLATMSASAFYFASQMQLKRDWRIIFKYMPMLMAIGVGLCVSNTRGIIEAVFGKQSEFVRTPKYGQSSEVQNVSLTKTHCKKKIDIIPFVEMFFGFYMIFCLIVSLVQFHAVTAAPFLLIFAFGFFYVSLMSFQAKWASKKAKFAQPQTIEIN